MRRHLRSGAWLVFVLSVAIPAIATAQGLTERIESNHRLYRPEGAGPFPTVVAIPGCSGVSLDGPASDAGPSGGEADRLFRRHYPRMAERLRARGLAVLLVDYLTAEGVQNTCGWQIPQARVGEYVGASIGFAEALPSTDVDRLFVIGWSYGGAGVMSWLQAIGTSPTPATAAIMVYPECDTRGPWSTATPTLLLLAGADDIALPERCEEIVRGLPETARATTIRYPGARHGFDWTEGPELYEIADGRTFGRDIKAGEAAWAEIFRFLESSGVSGEEPGLQ